MPIIRFNSTSDSGRSPVREQKLLFGKTSPKLMSNHHYGTDPLITFFLYSALYLESLLRLTDGLQHDMFKKSSGLRHFISVTVAMETKTLKCNQWMCLTLRRFVWGNRLYESAEWVECPGKSCRNHFLISIRQQ